MRFSISKLLADKAGNALMIFAAALIPLTIMVGSGIDITMVYMAQGRLQTACDAAVLAGRQSMLGNDWTSKTEAEAHKFFDFNFPVGTNGVTNPSFEIDKDKDDPASLIATAKGDVPTTIMRLFGFDTSAISATCMAKKEVGYNDVMMVLDVTGSMGYAPSTGGGSKISQLRQGTTGLYRALHDFTGSSITRFGIIPYSHTINIGTAIHPDFMKYSQLYNRRKEDGGYEEIPFTIRQTKWKTMYKFQSTGEACIEERASVGNAEYPIKINNYVTQADIDTFGRTQVLKFGRYDPYIQQGHNAGGCPSEVVRLSEFDSEESFQTAVNNATAKVEGGTYHDVGMLWGTRLLSRNGSEKIRNPTEVNGIPVQMHLVFMTDGEISASSILYSAHGVEKYQRRTLGADSQKERHRERFRSICSMAKSMGITVWVIAFDVTNVDQIEPCATSEGHFFRSNGSNLEDIFEEIGKNIGNLRLTK